MTDDFERRRLACHEAAHAVTAGLLGFKVDVVSIRPGKHFNGASIYRNEAVDEVAEILGRRSGDSLLAYWGAVPVPMFEPEEFSHACRTIMVHLAGKVGERFVPFTGARRVDEQDEEAAIKVARSLSPAQSDLLADAERSVVPNDFATAFEDAHRIAGREGANAFVSWLEAEVARLLCSGLGVALMKPTVAELLAHDAIGGEVVIDLIAAMPTHKPRRGLVLVADQEGE